jgi:formylglycine-generating enzyme required for sulfatase activity
MKFLLIPAGEFPMGSPATEEGRGPDEQQHTVRITRPYYLGVFEVTQEQYDRVMGVNRDA